MTGYNGSANYATHNITLWLTNDENTHQHLIELLKAQDSITPESAEAVAAEIFGERDTPDTKGNQETGTRWQDVDWSEIAQEFEELRANE